MSFINSDIFPELQIHMYSNLLRTCTLDIKWTVKPMWLIEAYPFVTPASPSPSCAGVDGAAFHPVSTTLSSHFSSVQSKTF
jgi:hypothetical protein